MFRARNKTCFLFEFGLPLMKCFISEEAPGLIGLFNLAQLSLDLGGGVSGKLCVVSDLLRWSLIHNESLRAGFHILWFRLGSAPGTAPQWLKRPSRLLRALLFRATSCSLTLL